MKGWLKIPGIRPDGDRTVEEQMLGLDRALAETAGATVLDLGCAEGAIGLAFERAGAKSVLGIEVLQEHLNVARKLCRGHVNIEFRRYDLNMTQGLNLGSFDIVLALGIIHKMHEPEQLLRWAARSALRLLCFRAPAFVEPKGADYIVRAKHSQAVVNVPATMRSEGFRDEGTVPGARGEGVQYWYRE